MKRATLIILSTVLLVALASSALAQPERGQRGLRADRESFAPGERQLERMTERLNLTAEQREKIGELQAKNRAEAVELRKQMARLQNELQGEMLKDKPAERTVVQLQEKLGEVRTKLQVNRARTRLAVREQLTPEQRDQMLLQRGSWSGRGQGEAGSGEYRGRGGRGGRGAQHFCCLHGFDCQDVRGPRQRPGR
jgi:Spy/CpxP family protein refolding chaperone